jgi:hypothetical protein
MGNVETRHWLPGSERHPTPIASYIRPRRSKSKRKNIGFIRDGREALGRVALQHGLAGEWGEWGWVAVAEAAVLTRRHP